MINIVKKLILASVSLGIAMPAFPGNDEGKKIALVVMTGAAHAAAPVATRSNARRNATLGALLALAGAGGYAAWRWFNVTAEETGSESDTDSSETDSYIEFHDAPQLPMHDELTVATQQAFEALEDTTTVTEVNLVIRGGNALTQEETYVRLIGKLYVSLITELGAKQGDALQTQVSYLLGKLTELLEAYKTFTDTHTSHAALQNRALQMQALQEYIEQFTANAEAVERARGATAILRVGTDNVRLALTDDRDFIAESLVAYKSMVQQITQ